MSDSILNHEQHNRAVDLAAQLIEHLPDGTPTDVAAIAALALVRYVAACDPSLAPRIAAVLHHTAHELVTGRLLTTTPH